MPSIFRPSTIAHPWRQALAVFAVLAWLAVVEHWLIAGPVLSWLVRQGGPFEWGAGMNA